MGGTHHEPGSLSNSGRQWRKFAKTLEDVKTISKLHNKTLQRAVERGTWERKQDIKLKILRPEEKVTESKGDDPMARMVLGLFWGHTKMLGLTSASQSSERFHSQDTATINVLLRSKQNMPPRYLSDTFLRKESEHTWKRGPNKQTSKTRKQKQKSQTNTQKRFSGCFYVLENREMYRNLRTFVFFLPNL